MGRHFSGLFRAITQVRLVGNKHHCFYQSICLYFQSCRTICKLSGKKTLHLPAKFSSSADQRMTHWKVKLTGWKTWVTLLEFHALIRYLFIEAFILKLVSIWRRFYSFLLIKEVECNWVLKKNNKSGAEIVIPDKSNSSESSQNSSKKWLNRNFLRCVHWMGFIHRWRNGQEVFETSRW